MQNTAIVQDVNPRYNRTFSLVEVPSRGRFSVFSFQVSPYGNLDSVRCNNEDFFISAPFRKSCNAIKIRQELIALETIHLNTITELTLNLVSESAQIAVWKAPELFSDIPFFISGHLWTELCF